MRADQLLVDKKLAASRSQAQRLLAAGVRWRLGADAPWQVVKKNSEELPAAAELQLLDDREAAFVSRGGVKLAGALQASDLQVAGKWCADVGQSTGGFTDCLLQAGAAHVVGVDVGHGQLHARLHVHPQVTCLEGLNARDAATAQAMLAALHTAQAARGEAAQGFDVLVGDVSFISLTLLLPTLLRLVKPQGHWLLLIKPQFELQPDAIGKGGLVKDSTSYALVERKLREACRSHGVQVLSWFESPITGGNGNREFFLHACV